MCQASRAGVLCGTSNVRRLRHAAERRRSGGVLCSTAGVMGFCRITGSVYVSRQASGSSNEPKARPFSFGCLADSSQPQSREGSCPVFAAPE